MENVKIQDALQNIYYDLEKAKDLTENKNVISSINDALSSLMEITEELNIEITI